jgi:hypothetical protein
MKPGLAVRNPVSKMAARSWAFPEKPGFISLYCLSILLAYSKDTEKNANSSAV